MELRSGICRKAAVDRCQSSPSYAGLEIAPATELSPWTLKCSPGRAVRRSIVHIKGGALAPSMNDCAPSTRASLLAVAFPSTELLLPHRTRRTDQMFLPNRRYPE